MNRVILIGNLGGPRRDNAPGGYDDDYPFPDEE